MSKVHNLLNTRHFLPLFICQFLSAFSDNFLRTSFITMVTYLSVAETTVNTSILSPLSMILFFLPFILLSVIGGQLADKFDKSSVIKKIKLLNILFLGIAAYGFIQHSYFFILTGIFLAGIQSALFGSAKYSILPDHLSKKDLILANALIEASTIVAILTGVIFGGFVIAKTDYDLSIIGYVLFGSSIICYISSRYIPKTSSANDKANIHYNVFKDTIACIQKTKKNNENFFAILGISWFWIVGGTLLSFFPHITKNILYSNESVYIFLMVLFAIGTALGSAFCNKILKNEVSVRYVPISLLLSSIFLIDLWHSLSLFTPRDFLGGIHYFLSSQKGLKCGFDVLFISFFASMYIVPLYTHLQVNAHHSVRSRVIAANNVLNAIFVVLAGLVSTALILLGCKIEWIILLLGLLSLLMTFYVSQILPDTVVKSFLHMGLKLLYRVKIKGMENFDKAGKRTLIIANHASFLDPLLIGILLPKRFSFAIDTHIAKSWWIRPFLKILRAFPIDPTNPMATKTLIDKLKNDESIVIFPEGRITVTGSLMKVYEGTGIIADKTDATLLPIRIDGPQFSLFSRMHGKMRIKLFPKFKITILKPEKLNIPKDVTGRDRRHTIGNQLYDIMSNMMFQGSSNSKTIFESLIEAKRNFGSFHTIASDIKKIPFSYHKIFTGCFILGKKIKQQTSFNEKVGVLLPNMAGTAVVFVSMIAHGRVPAMLNFSTGTKNMLSCCKTAKIKTIYTSKEFIEKADLESAIITLKEHNINILYLEDIKETITVFDKIIGTIKALMPYKNYKNYMLKYSTRINPNKPAVVLFTSGSEGVPKGVVLSHTNLISNLQQISSRVDFNASDKVFNALPMFHSFGLTAGTLLPLVSGVPIFFYPSPLHYRIVPEMVYGENATIFFGTDTFLSGYAKYAHPYDFFNIRYVVAGGEKLKSSTQKLWLEKFSIRILEGYGATEASPVISVNTAMHFKYGTVGRALPNIQYKLAPVTGIKEGGELLVSGPNIMLGYLKSDKPGVLQKTSCTINKKKTLGWYNTGDIVTIDSDNFITIQGRTKRFAKIGGEMVSLTAVEMLINELWPDYINAVINVEDAKKGEAIILFTNKEEASKKEIQALFKEKGVTELSIPKEIHYIEEFPILGAGKINYPELKTIYNKE